MAILVTGDSILTGIKRQNIRPIKICPLNDEPIEVIILTWPNNNTGTIVVCNEASKLGYCPLGRKYTCLFPLNPERRYAVGDPRSMA